MLVLTRKTGQSLSVFHKNEEIKITVCCNRGNNVKIGIDAPHDAKVYREEIKEKLDVFSDL